ncbi:hypothetical protein [Acidicapsa ligni]|uniref:hypothetical protein n=1 Tax=Acidicapsa ligni TaxID=542300 RepID=UPI0021E05C08|nr:hypothetical protein [Acidicapsa ligni]
MKITLTSLLLAFVAINSHAQTNASGINGFFHNWAARTTATQAKQPGWIVPLVTTTTGLIQIARFDATRQIAPTGTDTWNFGNSKGFNLVPWANTELVVNLPSYIEHNTQAKDGAADLSFTGKYRFLTGNEQHGNYTFTGFVVATIPTGSYSNGSHDATLQPNLGGGKGYGRFDVQTTLGATLPLGNTTYKTAGRPILWNTVAQYHVGKYFWPELESNATYYKGGTSDGKVQEFLTPGVVIGKIKLQPHDPKSRLSVVTGAGIQIATSHFHPYNHELCVTGRFVF